MTRDRDNPMHPDMWYVAVENRTVGPVTTELIVRGLESGKVPHDAMVCPVGASDWSWVSTVQPFVDMIRQSQPSPPVAAEPPPDDDYEDEETLVLDKQSSAPQPLPPVHTESDEPYQDRVPSLYGMDVAFAKAAAAAPPHFQSRPPDPAVPVAPPVEPGAPYSGERASRPLPLPPPSSTVRSSTARVAPPPVPPGPLPPPGSGPEPIEERKASLPPPPIPPAARAGDEEDGFDITVDVDDDARVQASPVDWTQPFVQQLDLPRGCTLPEDSALLSSLAKASTSVLLEEDAMWNLALCISFGSMAVATIAADRFFETVVDEHAEERLAWITRVLLSKGFMPSGIPQENGLRGIRVLRDNCPDDLRVALERHVLS